MHGKVLMEPCVKSSRVLFHFPHCNTALRNCYLLSISVLTKKLFKITYQGDLKCLFSKYIYIDIYLIFFISFNNKTFGNRLNEENIIWLSYTKSRH